MAVIHQGVIRHYSTDFWWGPDNPSPSPGSVEVVWKRDRRTVWRTGVVLLPWDVRRDTVVTPIVATPPAFQWRTTSLQRFSLFCLHWLSLNSFECILLTIITRIVNTFQIYCSEIRALSYNDEWSWIHDDPPITLHDSIKPAGLAHRGVAKFVRIQFGQWAVRASAASQTGGRRSASAGDHSPPRPNRIQKNLATKRETKPVALLNHAPLHTLRMTSWHTVCRSIQPEPLKISQKMHRYMYRKVPK